MLKGSDSAALCRELEGSLAMLSPPLLLPGKHSAETSRSLPLWCAGGRSSMCLAWATAALREACRSTLPASRSACFSLLVCFPWVTGCSLHVFVVCTASCHAPHFYNDTPCLLAACAMSVTHNCMVSSLSITAAAMLGRAPPCPLLPTSHSAGPIKTFCPAVSGRR